MAAFSERGAPARSRGVFLLVLVLTIGSLVGACGATPEIKLPVVEAPTVTPELDLQGSVVDAATARPLDQATVTLGERSTTTDDQGRFTLPAVQPGLTLTIERGGYRPASLAVDTDAGEVEAKLEPYVARGTVIDAATGKPLAGATVKIGDQTLTTSPDGQYRLSPVAPGAPVAVEAPGYVPASAAVDAEKPLQLALQPKAKVLTLTVMNGWTGKPFPGATVKVGAVEQTAGRDGKADLSPVQPGDDLQVSAPDFVTARATYSGQEKMLVELRPAAVAGTVTDQQGKPLARARVVAGKTATLTDQAGRFRLDGIAADATLLVRKEGFRGVNVGVKDAKVDEQGRPVLSVSLESRPVKSLYLTYYGVGSDELLGNALKLIEQTEANALVIDIKGDRGWIAYESKVPLVKEIGAQQDITIPDVEKLVRELKKRDIYLIARIVAFKDNPLALAKPEWAITDSTTGKPWIDNEQLAWIDATREESWQYNLALAKEAAEHGFDEVQFDYIRFPTDARPGSSIDAIQLSVPNTQENRTKAIKGFLTKARETLDPYGVSLGVDIFGYVPWRPDDMGIGQHLETIASVVDVICPMVYPNLFWHGLAMPDGIKYDDNPAAYPYEIVYESMKLARERIEKSGGRAELRPWLQYYNDYISGLPYGDREVKQQIKATYDVGLTGWMLWDPTNWFKKGGLLPRS